MFNAQPTGTVISRRILKGRHGSGNKGNFESGQNKIKTCSYILKDRECNALHVTMDTNCKLYFKRENILQLRTSNSFVDYQLPCPPLIVSLTPVPLSERRTGRGLPNFLILSYLSRSLADRWGTTVDFTTSFLHSSRFSAFPSVMFHGRPVHSLMLSSHRFLCLPLRLPSWTVPCRIVLASPDDRVTCPYHFSLRLFTVVRRSSYGPMAFPILAFTSSLTKQPCFNPCIQLK